MNKSIGPIVFLGTMNAMPMMYALELRAIGYDVLYFVDVPKSDDLSRPESHFPEISYPYPEWITEFRLPKQMLLGILPKMFARVIKHRIHILRTRAPSLFFLDGFFVTLAPYLNHNTPKVGLPHGSDLDSWADLQNLDALVNYYVTRSKYRWLPTFIGRRLIARICQNQFMGFTKCEVVTYFPKGFNDAGDRVLKDLNKRGVKHIPRYDISFRPLVSRSRIFKRGTETLMLLSPVRFQFATFSDGNTGYNKGNDKIIKGIAHFYSSYKNIEFHCFEKGPDVAKAKQLIDECGLGKVTVWHKTMSLKSLLDIYENSDICFDQVGDHWIGAVGCYALWLGKPLIANDRRPVAAGVWPQANPICRADSAESVCDQLLSLRHESVRRSISIKSHQFAEKYLGPQVTLRTLFNYLESRHLCSQTYE